MKEPMPHDAPAWESLPPSYPVWAQAFTQRIIHASAAPAPPPEPHLPTTLREGEPPYAQVDQGLAPLDERLIQRIWHHQQVKEEMLTESGRRLRVLDPGRWNHGPGPDFMKAELSLDGHPVRGDVEIHLDASGWRDHRHEADFAYNTVVLHVFLRNDDQRRFDRLHNGQKLERLCLETQLFPDLEAIRATMTGEESDADPELPSNSPAADKDTTESTAAKQPLPEPPEIKACRSAVAKLDDRVLDQFLQMASKERLEAKVARLERYGQAGDAAPDVWMEQALYQAIVTHLGQGATRTLYYLLARRAPLAELRDMVGHLHGSARIGALQAVLLHVAGLMPPDAAEQAHDDAARAYVQQLRQHWSALAPYYSDRLIPPTSRWFGNVRPGNFPTRQIAGLAVLIDRWITNAKTLTGAFRQQLPLMPDGRCPTLKTSEARKLIKAITTWLEVEAPRDFWASRYTLKARPAAAPMKLIGPARAGMMAFNALLPGMLMLGRHDSSPSGQATVKLAQRLYAAWPALPETRITRHMRWRLFGDTPRARDMLVGEARMQALYQIFADCCDNESPLGRPCGLSGASAPNAASHCKTA